MRDGKDAVLNPRGPLSRDGIKYAAMLAMLLNHVAAVFLAPGTLWAQLLTDIGYFTAPVMCWFLVEGYGRTRSRRRYALRLAAFAALSELPFCLAFTEGEGLSFVGMNMIFTLLVCFCILLALDRLPPAPARAAAAALTCLTAVIPCDWGLLAPAYTLLFRWAAGSRRRTVWAFGWAAGLFFLANWAAGGILPAIGASMGVAAAGAAILWLYSGRRAQRGRRFSQWFFYWFYPLHLLALGLVRAAL